MRTEAVGVGVALVRTLAATDEGAEPVRPGAEVVGTVVATGPEVIGLLGDDIHAATRALVAGPMANPSDRMVEPHEVAALVALVASPMAASINGANLRIDGGLTPTVN